MESDMATLHFIVVYKESIKKIIISDIGIHFCGHWTHFLGIYRNFTTIREYAFIQTSPIYVSLLNIKVVSIFFSLYILCRLYLYDPYTPYVWIRLRKAI